MIIVDEDSKHGLVILRRSEFVKSGEPDRGTFTMTSHEWRDLMMRMAFCTLESAVALSDPGYPPLDQVLSGRRQEDPATRG